MIASSTAPPRALLFDVGMTLIHVDGHVLAEELAIQGVTGVGGPDAVAALALAAEARHFPLPRARDGDERVALRWAQLLDAGPEPVVAAFRSAVRRPDLYGVLDPGAHEALTALRAMDIELAAVANAEGRLTEELAEFGLDQHFSVMIDSAVIGVEKPSPEIYHTACRALQVDPQQCWFVGDSLINDVLGARAAGVAHAILYDPLELFTRLPGISRTSALRDIPPAVRAARIAAGARGTERGAT
ncbi:HAD family hydrolase [Streptomyces sp. NPDC059989]|uniref:HAD family hydrolase n=1 Tax=Streptomyces sp. NPDC059989 TaxID=3347026 RepID=UPI0036B25565